MRSRVGRTPESEGPDLTADQRTASERPMAGVIGPSSPTSTVPICHARAMARTMVAFESVEARAAAFGALGDATRLRVIELLRNGELCVCRLQNELDVPPTLLSYHLRVLREAGLVRANRRGRWIDYGLELDAMRSLCRAMRSAECFDLATTDSDG